jgi:hypothetical protein
MKRWIFFFTFLGVLALASAISGISQFRAELGRETSISMHPNLLSRAFAAGEGIVLLVIAWAIYRRKAWIWRSLFYFFGVAWLYSVIAIYFQMAQQYPAQPQSQTLIFAGVVGLLIALVGGYWGYQWYKQKAYFFPDDDGG